MSYHIIQKHFISPSFSFSLSTFLSAESIAVIVLLIHFNSLCPIKIIFWCQLSRCNEFIFTMSVLLTCVIYGSSIPSIPCKVHLFTDERHMSALHWKKRKLLNKDNVNVSKMSCPEMELPAPITAADGLRGVLKAVPLLCQLRCSLLYKALEVWRIEP